MKIIFLISLTLLCFSGYAQTDSVRVSKWSAGIVFSPQYAYRNMTSEAAQRAQADAYDTLEKPKYGYSGGLMVNRTVGTRLSLSAGALFTDKGQQIKQLLEWRNYTEHYYFLDVPVLVNYDLISKKARLFVTAGLNSSISLYNRTTYFPDKSTTKQSVPNTIKLSPVHFGVIAGVGLSAPVSPRVDFKVTLMYRKAFTQVSDTPIQRSFYSFGADLGLFYKL